MSIRFPTQKREVLEAPNNACTSSQARQNAQFWINPPAWTYDTGLYDILPESDVPTLLDGGQTQNNDGAIAGIICRPMTRLRLFLRQTVETANLPDLQIAIAAGLDEVSAEFKFLATFGFQAFPNPVVVSQGAELFSITCPSSNFWGIYARWVGGNARRIQGAFRMHVDNAGGGGPSSNLFPGPLYNNLFPLSPPGTLVALSPYFVSSP